MIHSDGGMFEGNWYNNCAHGSGEFVSANGAKFVGEFDMDF